MYKVMLVEDEPPILNMIKDMINAGNNEFIVTSCAYNGKDALELLEKEVPDVIITDIRMPFLDGLELISQVNKIHPQIKCIILSGYSDFEYARSAIRLNAFDYLLKPIEPDSLFELLLKLHCLFEEQKAKDENEYLNAVINFQDSEVRDNFKMDYPFYFVVLVFAGHLSNQFYDVINPGKDFWQNCDIEKISSAAIGSNSKIWKVNGKYVNEKVFVIAGEDGSDNFIKEVSSKLMSKLIDDNIPINLISGHSIKSINEVGNLAKWLLSILSREIIFGKSNIYFEEEHKTNYLFITPEIEKKLSILVQQNNFITFKNSLKAIIYEWKELNYTQLAIQTIINHIINLFYHTLSKSVEYDFNKDFNVNEIIANSFDYEILYENICCVFKDLFDLKSKNFTGNMSARELVEEIEKYLNENYTSNITYKLFYEMFGYNETYITNVFRKVKGISPSRYITRLRIEKAKDIINRQPEVLLKNVSEMVGYEDPLYFSRVFKDFIGISPSEYTKTLK